MAKSQLRAHTLIARLGDLTELDGDLLQSASRLTTSFGEEGERGRSSK
jgi:hypothetical protein